MLILIYIIPTYNTLIKYKILYFIHYKFHVEIYENTSRFNSRKEITELIFCNYLG